MTLTATDVSGQKSVQLTSPGDETPVGEIVEALIRSLDLPATDVSGRPLTYHARLEREGRHLLASERVGDALQPGDTLVLQPSIDAGACH